MAFAKIRWFTLAGLTVILIGFGMGVWSWAEIAHTRNWASTEGRVIDHHIEWHRIVSRSSDGWQNGVRIRYSYAVDGRAYRSDRVYPATERRWGDEEGAAAFLADYPPGRVVRVHYDPADPREAALLLEGNYVWAYVLAGCGLLFTIIGLALRI